MKKQNLFVKVLATEQDVKAINYLLEKNPKKFSLSTIDSRLLFVEKTGKNTNTYYFLSIPQGGLDGYKP